VDSCDFARTFELLRVECRSQCYASNRGRINRHFIVRIQLLSFCLKTRISASVSPSLQHLQQCIKFAVGHQLLALNRNYSALPPYNGNGYRALANRCDIHCAKDSDGRSGAELHMRNTRALLRSRGRSYGDGGWSERISLSTASQAHSSVRNVAACVDIV
jgi:hypothetical protein